MHFLILLLLFLTGCTTVPKQPQSQNQALQHWLKQELNPYLSQQLSQHPRFKGKSLLLVKFNEQDISPDIDGFSKHIRNGLFNTLMQTPGVNLYWRPTQKNWQHHRRLADLDCKGLQGLSVYIGLSVETLLNQETRISVRALDQEQGQWISGFGKSWQGRLTVEEQQALTQTVTDNYLRGLRPLPFEHNQADLNAAYLAQNLACLLQQSRQNQHILFFKSQTKQSYFHQLQTLIANYISQFEEVQISDAAQDASVIVSQDIKQINSSLSQFWLIPRWKNRSVRISGVSTHSYVQLTAARIRQSNLISSLHRFEQQLASKNTATSQQATQLINTFDLVVPPNREDCQGMIYWDYGMKRLSDGARLPNGGCFGLSLTLKQSPQQLVLLQRNSQNQLIKLYPNQCRSDPLQPLPVAQSIRFPGGSNALGSVYKLDNQVGLEQFYLLASANNDALLQQLEQQLPDPCNKNSVAHSNSGVNAQALFKQLQTRQNIDWRTVSIQHIGE